MTKIGKARIYHAIFASAGYNISEARQQMHSLVPELTSGKNKQSYSENRIFGCFYKKHPRGKHVDSFYSNREYKSLMLDRIAKKLHVAKNFKSYWKLKKHAHLFKIN